ncbi:hypothetical protein DPMN_020451, partial [Dreissena polymorpha]
MRIFRNLNASVTEGQTDRQTDGQTDGPITICPPMSSLHILGGVGERARGMVRVRAKSNKLIEDYTFNVELVG